MKPVKAISIAVLPYIVIAFGLYFVSNALLAVALYFMIMSSTIVGFGDKETVKSLFRGWDWRIGIGLSLVSALAGLSLFILWPYLNKSGVDATEMLKNFGLENWQLIVFAIYLIFFNPFFEEMFWRSVLTTNTKADYIIDALFAGYHLLVLPFFLNNLGCILAYSVLILTSITWRYINKKYAGLAIPVVTHFIADFGIIVFLYFGI